MASRTPTHSPVNGRGGPTELPEPAVLADLGLTPEQPIVIRPYKMPPHAAIGADMHVSLELGVVVSGRRHENHGTGWFHVDAGQAWTLGSLEPHQWRGGSRGATILLFEFLPSLFDQMPNLAGLDPGAPFRSEVRLGPIGTSRRFRHALRALGRELVAKHQRPVPPGPGCVDLLRVLERVCHEVEQRRPVRPRPTGQPASASRIYPAIQALTRAPGRIVKVAEAARACRLSRTTFRRSFREMTGLSFGQFGLRWRLARAAHDLRATAEPIKAIAYRFGFTDASHFHHAFGAHYGMPPGRYRGIATR